MAVPLTTIFSWFETGDIPTQEQFRQTFSSFRHKDDLLNITEVSGLENALNNKLGINHANDVNAHNTVLAKLDASNLNYDNVQAWRTALGVETIPDNVGLVDDGLSTEVFNKDQIRDMVMMITDYVENGKIRADKIEALGLTELVPVTETSLAVFMTNNANYEYEKNDIIAIPDGTGNYSLHIYIGGSKTTAENYIPTGLTSNITIGMVQGLQAALDSKIDKPNATGNYMARFASGSVTWRAINPAASYLTIWNGNDFVASGLYYDGTNYGIGTTAPSETLHLNNGRLRAKGIVFDENAETLPYQITHSNRRYYGTDLTGTSRMFMYRDYVDYKALWEGFSDAQKNEIRSIINVFNGYTGVLLKNTIAPTAAGLYRLLELGTYPNLTPAVDENGSSTTITAVSGVVNEAYFDGTNWRESNIQLPSVAAVFNASNSTEPQGGKQISDWLFGQATAAGTYIESDVANTDTPINIGLSNDAILTIVDTGRTTTETISKFRFNGSSGLVRLIKYSKSGSNVTLIAYQDVTLNGSVVEVTPNTQMATLGVNEYYGIRMTSAGNGLAGRIGFESGTTPTYDCYSNVTNSGNLPDTFTLGTLFDNYKVGFNFDVAASTVSVFNDKFDERYDLRANSKNKVYGKKINVLGDSISTSSGGGNANLGTDKQYYGLMKTRDNCTIYVNAVAGSSIVTGGQADTVDFTNDTRISSMTTNSPDVILIFGGINDFLQDLPLGNLGDTSKTASFYGALDYLYKNILTQNPNARVFHMTPLHTIYSQGGGLIPEYNGQNYLSEYIEAIYKVARRYGVSIIDTNTLTGITCYNIASYADDLIHVKEAGHELIYKAVINELNRML